MEIGSIFEPDSRERRCHAGRWPCVPLWPARAGGRRIPDPRIR